MPFALLNSFESRHTIGTALLAIAATIMITLVVQVALRIIITKVVRRIVRPHYHQSKADERKREDTLISIFDTATALVLWIIAIILILWEAHVNIAALLTGAGLIGVIIGLGAQSTIKSYLAGIFIITENQYRVGDVITLNGIGVNDGISGVVEDISIRITKLRDADGNLHIVNNGMANVITNRTYQFAAVNIDLNVSYDADVDKLETVLNEIGAQQAGDPLWSDAITEPIKFLRVNAFTESAAVVRVSGKVRAGSQWDVAGDYRKRVLHSLAKAHLSVQLPQLVVQQQKSK